MTANMSSAGTGGPAESKGKYCTLFYAPWNIKRDQKWVSLQRRT